MALQSRSAPLVVLSAYNGSRFLPRQLESLQAQTIPFRALLRDDGSTDDTPQCLSALCQQDSRFLLSPSSGEHLGVTGAFRALMLEAAAQQTDVALCDQDDWWHPEKLQALQSALADAEAAFGAETPLLVHSDGRVVNASGDVLYGSLMRHQGWRMTARSLPELLMQNNVTGCMLMMNAALCRLSAAHMPPSGLHMHDWFIALTAAAFGQIIPVSTPLVDYRLHDQNVMGASRSGLMHRMLMAAAQPERIRARLRLSWENAALFAHAYEGLLPTESQEVLDDFLQIPQQRKWQRICALQRGNFRMQRPVTQLAALLFA